MTKQITTVVAKNAASYKGVAKVFEAPHSVIGIGDREGVLGVFESIACAKSFAKTLRRGTYRECLDPTLPVIR